MTIVVYVAIFWLGFLTGAFSWMMITNRFKEYGGTLYVSPDESDDVKYSFILEEQPEEFENENEVIFKVVKVDSSEESSDRG